MNLVKAWARFGKRVWVSLGCGWACSVLWLFSYISASQAGALLICAAIVAEVLHEKRHRLFIDQVQPGLKQSHLYREVTVANEARKDIEITPHNTRSGKSTVNTTSWALFHLARKDEFFAYEGTRLWDLARTMKRAERLLDYCIVTTAVIGTLMAAFG